MVPVLRTKDTLVLAQPFDMTALDRLLRRAGRRGADPIDRRPPELESSIPLRVSQLQSTLARLGVGAGWLCGDRARIRYLRSAH